MWCGLWQCKACVCVTCSAGTAAAHVCDYGRPPCALSQALCNLQSVGMAELSADHKTPYCSHALQNNILDGARGCSSHGLLEAELLAWSAVHVCHVHHDKPASLHCAVNLVTGFNTRPLRTLTRVFSIMVRQSLCILCSTACTKVKPLFQLPAVSLIMTTASSRVYSQAKATA